MGTLPAGTIIDARYRVLSVLGAGAMGCVYLAEHVHLGEKVAVKVQTARHDPRLTERFLREARATFALRSDYIARTLDAGTLDDGVPYLVMEHLVGETLSQRVESSSTGRLSEPETLRLLMQCCVGLTDAHERGLVHRDIKPSNIMVTRSAERKDVIKLLDFGISKSVHETSLTLPHELLGSPNFMAPEQWVRAAEVDARADIFAVGVVGYYMLTGTVPLLGIPLGEQRRRLLATAFPSPRQQNPNVHDDLSRVIMRALRPRPEERYGSASEFERALAALAARGHDGGLEGLAAATILVRGETQLAHDTTSASAHFDNNPNDTLQEMISRTAPLGLTASDERGRTVPIGPAQAKQPVVSTEPLATLPSWAFKKSATPSPTAERRVRLSWPIATALLLGMLLGAGVVWLVRS
jgi:serine/threonine-protein kinase